MKTSTRDPLRLRIPSCWRVGLLLRLDRCASEYARSRCAPRSRRGVVPPPKQYLGVRYVLGGPRRALSIARIRALDLCPARVRMRAREGRRGGRAPVPGDLQPGDLCSSSDAAPASRLRRRGTIIHARARGRVKLDRFGGTRARPTWFGGDCRGSSVLPAEGGSRCP